ncbi:ERI1 exoribonuclease 3 isoform X5 [Pteronotus mesoamericanus]|uniref:ERI1 exoribonuclease 3 isoform X5 n=1 Tax=Pteronotus mesoamericanus TaxID=1884717 RepID=UPI0023ECCD4F|nr:ERI1 exoribonuclease 3 isoform X5 [Pteronotus parnellii mesoamericanus]
MRPRETSGPALGGSLPRWPQGGGVAMATASPAADGGRGRPWEGGLVSWPPAPPLTLPWTWMGPSWGQHPGHWGFPALTEPSASPAASLGIFEVRRDWTIEPSAQTKGNLYFGKKEIIEFPILKLNGRTMEIESTFHMYVQPVVHPQLTPFCTELTGIIQAMVDGQPSLQQVLERVDEWMAKEGLLDPNVKSIFVTCGDWDLKVMLPGQCQYLGLPVADYFKQWINLKKAYSFAMGCWPKNGLLDMNKGLSLQHIGRPHSGIDDCKNIANIMKTLAYRGFIFKQTSKPF